jgi:hypothetical protein
LAVQIRGKVKATGRRKPISISGAGKVVGGILRRRPCFFVPCTSVVVFASLRFFSQPGDLRFQGNYSLNAPPKLLQIAGGADE